MEKRVYRFSRRADPYARKIATITLHEVGVWVFLHKVTLLYRFIYLNDNIPKIGLPEETSSDIDKALRKLIILLD